jgi:hypothetical protein
LKFAELYCGASCLGRDAIPFPHLERPASQAAVFHETRGI